ncbi:hypothetical protein LSUE1_G004335 [Lachnellula suecica]|uniref:Uncharacterized protein n=1 Tax=Lachnellula suecica TaxID=602035 RepID=A0A8T9CCY3_9HELO|nr:hypothetical protein LSUE1_G004335 [Lachnellula suecica]
MSSTSTTNPTSPILGRDIRSNARGFKRDKDAGKKWSMGTRPLAGAKYKISLGAESVEPQPEKDQKVRPVKSGYDSIPIPASPQSEFSSLLSYRPSLPKNRANTTPKPTSHSHSGPHFDFATSRVNHKVEATFEANDPALTNLSKSLLELLPQHANNTNSAIHTALRDANADARRVIYSFDNKASPRDAVALGSLVEQAEQKFLNEQTDAIVKGEYEVLDASGEPTVLKGKRKSPKQKAAKNIKDVEEDDGFELV